jgi:tetratricopeptide (TPR) repeat protein
MAESPTAEEAEVEPALSDQWVPESQLEIEPEETPVPAPSAPEEAVAEEEGKPDPKSPEGILAIARENLQSGNLEEAIAGYNKLVKKGKIVETVIEDILGATQRYPVEYNLWQTLGDAYMRSDNLQEALDAYTKAEELLR